MNYELVKFVNDNLELEITISPKEETVWMSKEQIACLFDRDRTVISRHIKRWRDIVIAVGYRVKSPNATVLRKWATNVLKEYLLRDM